MSWLWAMAYNSQTLSKVLLSHEYYLQYNYLSLREMVTVLTKVYTVDYSSHFKYLVCDSRLISADSLKWRRNSLRSTNTNAVQVSVAPVGVGWDQSAIADYKYFVFNVIKQSNTKSILIFDDLKICKWAINNKEWPS
jgi:hypothetical protein